MVTITLTLSLLLAAPKPPEEPPLPRAQRVELSKQAFFRAELLYRQAKFRKALKAYHQAMSHQRHPAYLFNIAQCHRLLAEHRKALFFYKLYLSEQPNAPNRDAVVQETRNLEGKIAARDRAERSKGRLSVNTTPPGAEIRIDSVAAAPVGTSPSVVRLSPGQHLVVIRRAGYGDVQRTVEIKQGKITLMAVRLRRLSDLTGDGADPARRPFYRRWWFWTGAALAVVAAGTAAATGATTLRMQKEWDKNMGAPYDDAHFESRAKALRTTTDVMIGLSAAAAVATVIGAIAVSRQPTERPAARVTPSCGAQGCGLWVTGRF